MECKGYAQGMLVVYFYHRVSKKVRNYFSSNKSNGWLMICEVACNLLTFYGMHTETKHKTMKFFIFQENYND